MTEKTKVEKLQLDPEWVELVKKAREIGIPIEDIKQFFSTANKK